ncbi:MAG: hypothetical protein HY547_08920 [Elusimicrobia bacterium]|nr:hypothetical protein [Elusimicrobiota bacterium]
MGGYAGDIWTFGAGARSLGLGNASIELADDATAAYWNPARLSYVSRMNFNFLHSSLYEGGLYDYSGWAYPTLAAGTLGLSIVRLGIGDVEERDASNNLVGNYSFSNTGFGLSYGNQFGPSISLGGSLKYLARSLPGASSSLFSFDLATDFKAFKFGEIGLVLRDVFYTGMNTSDQLPLNATLGISYGLFEGALRLSGQVEQRGPAVRAGIEYGLGPASLRLGLGGTEATTGGIGFRFQDIQFDYAVLVNELGSSNRFSFGYWFGRDMANQRKSYSKGYAEKAVEAYRDGKFLRASRLVDRALSFNPNDALLMGRQLRLQNVVGYLRLTRQELKRPAQDAPEKEKQKYVYIVRGISDYIEANADNAILLLRQALAFDPSDEGLRRILESVAKESGKTAETDKPLLAPAANLGAKLNETDRYFRQGRFDMVIKACEEVVKLDPANALAYERMGSAYFALGIRDKAVEMWQKSLEIKPDNTSLRQFINNFFGK